jgi:hypothetical protein
MTGRGSFSKPLSRRTMGWSVKARPALRDDPAQVTQSIFVAGGEDAPQVETKAIPVQRTVNGCRSLHYEGRLDVHGVRLGERALHLSPAPNGCSIGAMARKPC